MANDIQMGEPKADVHPPDMISDAISQPEEAAGLEATPMAVEAAAAAGATAEAMTEATPEAVVEETMEAVPEATPQATREAMPGAAAEATTEATPEATTEDKTQGSTEAQTEALTESKTEATTEAKTAAVADGAEGSHAPTGGDDAVVDEVIDAADDFGGSRVVEREGSENGNYDEPSSRRGRRGRSRSRSRDRVGAGANGDNSRDRGRRRDNEDRERERDHDRSRGRDRDVGSSREHRDRGRDDSRDRNRGGNGGRDRDRGRENSRERERGRGSSRDRDWSRDERDWGRGRDRDSFDNTRDRGRQSGGHGQGSITHRRDRGPTAPMDGGRMDGRAGGREPFRGRGPPGTGPMMQPMGGGSLPMMQPMGGPGAPMFPPPASAHGQMVFSTNQRPQPMKMAGQTRMYNILPMISFKAFMAEQREDVTPEECKQRYDEYKADYTQRLTHSFIDVHRKEEWLLERYHPKMIQQKKEDKIKWVAQESAAFALQLRANPVAFIASAALDPISEQQRWGGVDKRKKRPRVSSRDETSVDGMEDDSDQPGESEPKDGSGDYDMDAKEFSAHTDKVVFIRRVPAWISTEELGRQIAVEAPKHERIVCSDAANTRNEDFARSAFIIYDTPEKAAKSVQKLNKMRIYQNQKPKAKVSKKVSNGDSKYFELKTFSYKPRTHTAADHDFSDAKRIVHDTRQSLKVAEAMDEEFGRTYMPESIAMLLREPEIQEALSSSPAGTAELDLVCAYMKRVHLYLYYRGQQCRDEGDMISSRSACRGTEAASKEDVQEAFRLADAETLATMDGDTPSASGRGVGAGAADNGAAASAARGGKKREFGTEYVDECAINRIKDAGRAEERNKKDGAILERYEARVKEDVEAWQNLHTGRTEEGYARCGMAKCAKLFKAAEFVHKHLINKHPEKHKVVVDQATDPFVRELFFADDVKPLPNIVADANTPPVVLLPGAMAMGGSVPAMPPVPPPMGAPGFPMMGGGMPMGPMGPMGPPGQMGGMGDFPMQMQMPPDVMMGSGGRGFRGGRGGGGGGGPSFRGRGSGGGGRFGGRGMGRMDNRPVEPIGPRDPRSLVSYIDVDAPKETTPNLDYGDAFPSRSKKKRKTM